MFPGVDMRSFLDSWGFFMKVLFKVAIFAVIFASLVVSCGYANGADAGETLSKAEEAKDPDAKYYSFSVDPAAVALGAQTAITITVNPADGYKWNDEYPAKFVVSAGEGVTLGKTEFKSKKKDILLAGKKATFKVPLTAANAGTIDLTLKGGFSVCNDTSCKIFRKKTITLKVDAK